MMRKVIVLALTLSIGLLNGQGIIEVHGINKSFTISDLCLKNELRGLAPAEMNEHVSKIKAINRIQHSFQVIECDQLDNKCAAFMDQSTGEKYILYDPAFINHLERKSNWAAIGVLAHEIGHHHHGHTAEVKKQKNPRQMRDEELDCDLFAGGTLYEMGASLEESKEFINALDELVDCAYESSSQWPCRESRLKAIEDGWGQAWQADRGGSVNLARVQSLAGPEASLYSLLLPGLGHSFVQDKFKVADYIIPALAIGSVVYGFTRYSAAHTTWDEYLVAKDRTEIADLKDKSDSQLQQGYIFMGVGAALWLTDVVRVLAKGKKNRKLQKELSIQPGPNPSGLGLSLRYALN